MACKKACEDPCKSSCETKKVGTSDICYDGTSLKGLCIEPGMNLNTVLAKIDEAVMQLYQATIEPTVDVFTELEDGLSVTLSQQPYKILYVSYCGATLPASAYTLTGKCIRFNAQYCIGDGNEVRVVYTAKFSGNCG